MQTTDSILGKTNENKKQASTRFIKQSLNNNSAFTSAQRLKRKANINIQKIKRRNNSQLIKIRDDKLSWWGNFK
jgi:hypothetical protein